MSVVDALVLAGWAWVLADNLRLARCQRAARAALGPPIVSGTSVSTGARVALVVVLASGAIALESLTGGQVATSRVVTLCGVALLAAGVTLHLVARRHLGAQWASDVTVLARHELVTSGPYALVRHPLYLAVALMALGTVLAHPSAATGCLAVGLLGGIALKSAAEDRALRTALGARHTGYAARVPAVVPRARDVWNAVRGRLSHRSPG